MHYPDHGPFIRRLPEAKVPSHGTFGEDLRPYRTRGPPLSAKKGRRSEKPDRVGTDVYQPCLQRESGHPPQGRRQSRQIGALPSELTPRLGALA